MLSLDNIVLYGVIVSGAVETLLFFWIAGIILKRPVKQRRHRNLIAAIFLGMILLLFDGFWIRIAFTDLQGFAGLAFITVALQRRVASIIGMSIWLVVDLRRDLKTETITGGATSLSFYYLLIGIIGVVSYLAIMML